MLPIYMLSAKHRRLFPMRLADRPDKVEEAATDGEPNVSPRFLDCWVVFRDKLVDLIDRRVVANREVATAKLLAEEIDRATEHFVEVPPVSFEDPQQRSEHVEPDTSVEVTANVLSYCEEARVDQREVLGPASLRPFRCERPRERREVGVPCGNSNRFGSMALGLLAFGVKK